MKWLVVACFVIFAIGFFGALINISRGKYPWSQNSRSLSDTFRNKDNDHTDPDSKGEIEKK